jgi:hypothetical protein
MIPMSSMSCSSTCPARRTAYRRFLQEPGVENGCAGRSATRRRAAAPPLWRDPRAALADLPLRGSEERSEAAGADS